MRDLTPYDTGERAQPHLWVAPGNAASLDPAVNPYADELRENYGRVDFDDDESSTVATVHLSKRDDGGYTVHIIPACDDVTIEWHGEGSAKIHEDAPADALTEWGDDAGASTLMHCDLPCCNPEEEY